MRTKTWRALASASLALAVGGSMGCGDDGLSAQPSETGTETGDGDGDGDGEPGDGDGEPPGDGDGDEPAPDPCAVELPPPQPPAIEPTACVSGALEYAPPVTMVDGLVAGPIDILELDASVEFHPRARTACAEATLRFQLGPEGGMPLLDLRQELGEVWLDGQPLAPEAFELHGLGQGTLAGMRVLEAELEPCSTHELVLRYALDSPYAFMANAPVYLHDPERVSFTLQALDVVEGRQLEAWFPANLPYDRHPTRVRVALFDAAPHTLMTNAKVTSQGASSDDAFVWQLEFPPEFTTLDPMLTLEPGAKIESTTGVHVAANGQEIPWALHLYYDEFGDTADHYLERIETALDTFVVEIGDYPHAELSVLMRAMDSGEEHAGAIIADSGYLEHNLHHSWWGRGRRPASFADSWIDEAWTRHAVDLQPDDPAPLDPAEGPWQLYDPHPFARKTVDEAWVEGAKVFAGLAVVMGPEQLDAAMRDYYLQDPTAPYTTAGIERHLYCASGELAEVREIFHRYVYGLAGEPEPIEGAPCE